ncbi:MAG: hypothetical protein HY702_07060 [Gemmatimonadetes bacterium]|nr:hypothetical protein [Gemmatimonadota bacterium]
MRRAALIVPLVAAFALTAAAPRPAPLAGKLYARGAPGDSSALRIGYALVRARDIPELRTSPLALDVRFRPRFSDWAFAWARKTQRTLAALDDSLWRSARTFVRSAPAGPEGVGETPGRIAGADAVPPQEPRPRPRPGPAQGGTLPDIFGPYADLNMRLQGRLELSGGWNRFRPCDLTFRLNCNPGLVPTLKPDVQFGVRVGGTVSERIHVNVDYDNAREFDAANNINVYYAGFEDEILKRVEVGDVTFDLPASRYLTYAIPAGNFGFRATGQFGPLDFQTVWAQQKGDLGTRTLTLGAAGQGFVQDQTTVLDDADYQRGQFFFLFHPRHVRGYPHIDIQQLQAVDADPQFRPSSTIKVYRYEGAFRGTRQGTVQENTIEAIAVALDTIAGASGDTVVADTLRGTFRVLEEGKDYFVHHSALWLMLRSPVSPTEGLAVVYITDDGRPVGTFDAEGIFAAHVRDSTQPLPALELLKDVNHRPGEATWEREMHHVYRISGSSGVELGSVQLVVSQGEASLEAAIRLAPSGTPVNFLKIFGLDDEPFDERLDRAHLFEPPTQTTAGGETGPTGTYVVFPTLRPFLQPPPLQGLASDPLLNGQPFPLETGDANSAIYTDPIDLRRQGTTLYRLTLTYRTRGEGLISSFSIGAVGVREGSERITIGSTPLQRGTDYDIDYSTGRVDLRDPDRWFANNPGAQIRVTYEQKPLFQLAPTSVFGFHGRAPLGRGGELNFMGLAQTEKTLQTRPELGLEPGAMKLGGVSGKFQFEPAWLTRAINALPGIEAELPSSIALDGEIASSLPTTNTQGTTYVEDFEGGTGFELFLTGRAWQLGSRPSTAAGAEAVLPSSLDETTLAPLVWQDQFVESATGRVVGPLQPRQIDDELRIRGQFSLGEPVLYMSVGTAPEGGRGWRSMTTVISPTGRDFTTLEFLEFYVGVADAVADSIGLVLDLGTLSEDAFVLDSLGLVSGLGRLDQEADRTTQIWSDANDIGLWRTGCIAQRGVLAYPLGDERATCTRNNGLNDSEDLNGDNRLQVDERHFRYTLRVGDAAGPYFVRDANAYAFDASGNPVARFRLFRIPLRRPDVTEGAGFAEFQNIRHLRVTVSSSSPTLVILARVQFLGSRWLKRGENGVVQGIADTFPPASPASLVEVGPISTTDANYVPPPGVTDQLAARTDVFGIGTAQFNEQSLRIRFQELAPGERAEVYLHYLQTPRDFLTYRALRVWGLGWEGDWGTDEMSSDLRFFVKLGEDVENFYLYRARLPALPPGPTPDEVRAAWRPEIVIDFERLIVLRAFAEDTILRSGGLPDGKRLVLWDADVFPDGDSTYAIVISQRSRAPNLAALRQIGLGVWNVGDVGIHSGEVWVDDVRLDRAVDNAGLAGQLNVSVRGSDLFDLRGSFAGQNPYFRQLGATPGFQSSQGLDLSGTLRVGRFLPDAWGLDMPLSLSYRDDGTRPFFLPRSDILGEQLRDLRTPERSGLRADVSLRRAPGATPTPLVGWLVDNLSLRLSWASDKSQGQRSLAETEDFSVSLGYQTKVGDVSVPLFPGILRRVFSFLPSSITGSRLRLTPRELRFSAEYGDATTETRRFESIVRLPGDAAVTPVMTFRNTLRHTTSLQLLPLSSLEGRLTLTQDRDLVPSDRVVSGEAARRRIDDERASLFGLPVGWETGRNLGMNFSYRPKITAWFTPSASITTGYNTRRNPSYIGEAAEGDTALFRDFGNSRFLQASTQLNPRAALAAATGKRGGIWKVLRDGAGHLDVVQLSWTGSIVSDFQRQTANPGLGYQLVLGSAESYRVIDGDTASRVITNNGWSANSGLLFPLGAVLSVNYRVSEGTGWTPRSQRETRTVEWPGLQFSWSRMPIPKFARPALQSVSLRVGYSQRETEELNVRAEQLRMRDETRIPASVTVGLPAGWQLSYSWDRAESRSADPSGRTEGSRVSQSIRLVARLLPPQSWRSFRNPIRVNLAYRRDSSDQCRALGVSTLTPGTPPGCAPFTDLVVQSLDLTLDTDVQPFTLGFQASWRDQQSEIGQRPGSTQLTLTLFGHFLFQTGPVR